MDLKIALSILAIFFGNLFTIGAAGQAVADNVDEKKVYQFTNGRWKHVTA